MFEVKITTLQKRILTGLFTVLILFFIVWYWYCFNEDVDIERRKRIGVQMIFGLLMVMTYVAPITYYVFFTTKEWEKNNPHGGLFQLWLFVGLIVSFIYLGKYSDYTRDLIDPNDALKRELKYKQKEIQKENDRELEKINEQIKAYTKIQLELNDLNRLNELCDYDEIHEYIKEVQTSLQTQKLSLEQLEEEYSQQVIENTEQMQYIDSLYTNLNKIDSQIGQVINEETWYKSERYLEYVFAFFLGILSNIGFFYLRKMLSF